ncbi:MAG: M48 family metallopeptidase [Spirochaetia bacterium]|jgi:Zn-dependent protease with chaperone function|nr:M48 family metallopeptidase [Spirochaetia bacterium]
MQITTENLVHPLDSQALEDLKSLPNFRDFSYGFSMELNDDILLASSLSSKIRLSDSQLPTLYVILKDLCKRLDIKVPYFFLEISTLPSIYTLGFEQPAITITSGLVDQLTEEQTEALLARECGHILCGHTMYKTMAHFTSSLLARQFGTNMHLTPSLLRALNYWDHISEATADRVCAVLMNDPELVQQSLVIEAGGNKAGVVTAIDYDQLQYQAKDFTSFMQQRHEEHNFSRLAEANSFLTIRLKSLADWCDTTEYRQLAERCCKR